MKKRLAIFIILALMILLFILEILFIYDRYEYVSNPFGITKIDFDGVVFSSVFVNELEKCARGENISWKDTNKCNYLPDINYLDDLRLLENVRKGLITDCSASELNSNFEWKNYTGCRQIIDSGELIWSLTYKPEPTRQGHKEILRKLEIIKIDEKYYLISADSPEPTYYIYRLKIQEETVSKLKNQN